MNLEQQSGMLLEGDARTEFLKTREGVLAMFQSCKEDIELICGIKLSNIELVKLRHITEEVMPIILKEEAEGRQPGSLARMSFDKEIGGRFLSEYYGISAIDLERWYSQYGSEVFREYMRRKQAEMHHI